MAIEVRTGLPGPKAKEYLEKSRLYEPRCMSEQVGLVWKRAKGVRVEDVDGNEFLDFCSGVLVANIGHCHPRYVAEMQAQCAELFNCYDFVNPWRVALAEKLVKITSPGLTKAFILTTGSETIEAALKLARRYSTGYEVLAFDGSFHGRTYGAMTAGGKLGVKKGFGPLVPGFIHAPFPYCYRCPFGKEVGDCGLHCLEHLDWVVETRSTGELCAVITESYQGGAGSIVPPPGYMEGLYGWAKDKGLVFILDEVQSSFGRTGKMFAYEHWGIEPDLLCLGKGISSGVPCSALVGREEIMGVLGPGEMSSTNGGNPLSCRAAVTAIKIVEEEKLAANAARQGKRMMAALNGMKGKFRGLGDIRGMGLAIGLEMVEDKKSKEPSARLAKAVIQEAWKRGLAMIAPIGFYGNVIRIAPPLVINDGEVDEGLGIVEEALKACD